MALEADRVAQVLARAVSRLRGREGRLVWYPDPQGELALWLASEPWGPPALLVSPSGSVRAWRLPLVPWGWRRRRGRATWPWRLFCGTRSSGVGTGTASGGEKRRNRLPICPRRGSTISARQASCPCRYPWETGAPFWPSFLSFPEAHG